MLKIDFGSSPSVEIIFHLKEIFPLICIRFFWREKCFSQCTSIIQIHINIENFSCMLCIKNCYSLCFHLIINWIQQLLSFDIFFFEAIWFEAMNNILWQMIKFGGNVMKSNHPVESRMIWNELWIKEIS